MNYLAHYLLSVGAGTCFGLYSARMLLYQTAQASIKHSIFWIGHSLLRIGILGLTSWYLLHWGTLPLILFGGSLLLAMWAVILTYTD